MNAALDVQRAGTRSQMQVLLKPRQCQPLSTEVLTATPASCKTFAMSKPATELAAKQ